MIVAGILLAAAILAVAYLTWQLAWQAVLSAAVAGVVLTQVGHARGWREVATTAGSICLFAAVIGTLVLVLQVFMG